MLLKFQKSILEQDNGFRQMFFINKLIKNFFVFQVPPVSSSIKSEIISSDSSASTAYLQQQHSSNSNCSNNNLKFNGFEPYYSSKCGRTSIVNTTKSSQITEASESSPR